MAHNFEIIFNLDTGMIDAENNIKVWSIQDVLHILEKHNCKWIIATHTPDELCTFNHFHLGIHTSSSNTYDTIAKWFNLPVNSVEKIRKTFETTYALYLIHHNHNDKTQIDPSTVLNNFNLDYDKLIKRVESKQSLDKILEKIDTGEIKPYNYTEHITLQEYTKWKRQIDNAFAFRTDRLRRADRNMQCIFITGDSGTGKTTYAKEICTQRGFHYYVSSGSNDVLDDYKGEEAIILDDLRPSCMSLSDLLKMLDNNTASSVKSRFKNKVLECKLIVITSTLPIDEFFSQVFENENETKIQLMRRCTLYITMTTDYMYCKIYNPYTREYIETHPVPNPIKFVQEIKQMSEEEQIEKISELLGTTADNFKLAQQQVQSIKGFIPAKDIEF